MILSDKERRFLSALIKEQNRNGCRGPAHDLLRQQAYPDAPLTGPGSLAFAYDAVPLSGLLLKQFDDLQGIDDFLRTGPAPSEIDWPWSSALEFRARLQEAQAEWANRSARPAELISRD
jgi:hypothetical protein